MAAIDVGAGAIDRGVSTTIRDGSFFYTKIDYNNPANGTGALDIVKAWFFSAVGGNSCKIGTFTDDGGGDFTCNDAEEIGEVTAGSEQTYSGLSIDISTGEYIGIDARTTPQVYIESDASGFSGMYWKIGQYADPTDTATFALEAGQALSLYGTGVEISYLLAGVTKDKDGNVKANCECFLCKDNLDDTASFIAYTQSDGSGNYSFTGLIAADYAQYFVISWKDETPHIFDVTDHVLQPVEE